MSAVALSEEPQTEGIPYFDPEHYVINIVRRATANHQDVRISHEEIGGITVLSTRGEFFSSTDDLAGFCKRPAESFRVEVLRNGDARIPPPTTVGRNVDELMWTAAFHASAGRLMQGCYRDDVVQLSYWPNLTRLPRTPNTMRICALLSRYPTSITLASRLLKVEREELFTVYSAARCAGLAQALNRKPEEPPLQPHRDRSLLSLLLGKIAGL